MANPVSIFSFQTEDLATFLAKAVSDGTYANVFDTLKVDNQAAAASQVFEYAGQLLSNGVDDFIQSSYPYIRTVSLGGQRLKETPSPSFGGAPGAFTYTLAADERINFSDIGPPGTFTVTMPDVTALTTDQTGAEASFRLSLGNPLSAITVAVPAGNVIVDPQTGADAGPPGTGFTIPAATYSAGTIFTWKAVGGSQDRWVLEYDQQGSGGGASGWPAELAIDQTTGSNSPQIDDGQELQYGPSVTKVKAPAHLTLQDNFASGGTATYVQAGGLVYTYDATSSIHDRVTVRAVGNLRISNGTIATTDLYPFTLKQELELSSGGDSLIATHDMDGSGVGQVRFNVSVAGPFRSLILEVDEGPNVGYTVDVLTEIEVSAVKQEIA